MILYLNIFWGNYRGMALFPFIIIKSAKYKSERLINHEKIHIKQQLELLILPFYLWYLIDFIIKYIRYKNWKTAYRNIVFEREAYANQYNLSYLKHRKPYSFKNYLNP